MKLPGVAVCLRWLLAVAVSSSGIWMLARTLSVENADWISVFAKSIVGLGGIILAVALVSPEFVAWTLGPVNSVLDSIFMPTETSPPPADYHLPRHYVNQLRFDEAVEEYAKIIRYHPNEKMAYLEGIHAARAAGNDAQARKFYRAATRRLRGKNTRRLLDSVYAIKEPALVAIEDEEESAVTADPVVPQD